MRLFDFFSEKIQKWPKNSHILFPGKNIFIKLIIKCMKDHFISKQDGILEKFETFKKYQSFPTTYLIFLLWTFLICCNNWFFVENDLLQMSQFWSLFPSWIVFMWVFKIPAQEKDSSQNSHLWSLWPSWMVLMWVFRSPDREKDFPHELHL